MGFGGSPKPPPAALPPPPAAPDVTNEALTKKRTKKAKGRDALRGVQLSIPIGTSGGGTGIQGGT